MRFTLSEVVVQLLLFLLAVTSLALDLLDAHALFRNGYLDILQLGCQPVALGHALVDALLQVADAFADLFQFALFDVRQLRTVLLGRGGRAAGHHCDKRNQLPLHGRRV